MTAAASAPPSGPPPSTARRTWMVAAAAVAVVFVAWYAARYGGKRGERPPQVVTLYAFSAMEGVFKEALLPGFRARRLAEGGRPVEIAATFAGSGAITERILAKVPVEVAVLSSEIDVHRLGYRGVRWGSWRELPHGGVVSRSPLIILVRAGNPKGIRDFADLGREGIAVVVADPATSGVANWAILAVYGAELRRTGDRAAAEAGLEAVWRRCATAAPSAHEALLRFAAGEGDALLTYEAEALGGVPGGRPVGEIVYPPETLLTEHLVTRIDKNVGEAQRPVVDALLSFLWSDEAQRTLVTYGFRSVEDDLNAANPQLLTLPGVFTLDDFGGAAAARREVLHVVWGERVRPRLGR